MTSVTSKRGTIAFRRARKALHQALAIVHKIGRSISALPRTSSPRIRLAVESPVAGATIGRVVTVRGWAFAEDAPAVRIHALVDGQIAGSFTTELNRADVYASYPMRGALKSGFTGQIRLKPTTNGPVQVIFVATSIDNARTETTIRFHVIAESEPVAEIERAEWCDGRLMIEGWALWPTSTATRHVKFYLDDECIGRARVNLSRLDVGAKFLQHPDAISCGFRFETPVQLEHDSDKLSSPASMLRAEFDNGQGLHFERQVRLPVMPPRFHTSAAIEFEVRRVLSGVRLNYDMPISILNWRSGIPNSYFASQGTVFSPPIYVSNGSLPYADRSVNVVIYASSNCSDVEALRVAADVAIDTSPSQDASSDGDTVMHLVAAHWRSGRPIKGATNVSIIMPLPTGDDSELTLEKLQGSLPTSVSTEIILVAEGEASITEDSRDERHTRIITCPPEDSHIRRLANAATIAHGDVLLFFDPGLHPEDDWLVHVLQCFHAHSDAGIVTGKIVNDTKLVSAGSVVSGDGSIHNIGAGCPQLDAPQYSYLREVHSCSAGMLATPRSLYNTIGGFDTQYLSAKYSFADYCFRARARDYKVYYQPAARVARPGSTIPNPGTDEIDDIAYFLRQWQELLTHQTSRVEDGLYDSKDGEAVSAGTENTAHDKRVLIVGPKMPEFDRGGGELHIYHIIRLLLEDGWFVTYIAENGTESGPYLQILQQLGVEVYAGPRSEWASDEFLSVPDTLIARGQFSLAITVFWTIGERYLSIIRSTSPKTKVIVSSIDLHFLRHIRQLFATKVQDMNLVLSQEESYAEEMLRELHTYSAADAVLCVSDKETALLADILNTSALAHSLPLMEDLEFFHTPLAERKGILFVGNFHHPPNIDAVRYLCHDIIPLMDKSLLAEHPISIVGNAPSEEIYQLASMHHNVNVVGWVPSLTPYLQHARIAIIPLRVGAGTKTKLIGSLMAGLPAVSTTTGIEGLELENERQVLVADSPEQFAHAMSRLCQDHELWQSVSTCGRMHIEKLHGRAYIKERLTQIIHAVTERS